MNNGSAKKKGWIKNIAIILLIVLLLLTFFSNTIMTVSLPEVSAQYGQYGTISSAVKLNGTIKANESYKVVYEPTESSDIVQSRKVKSVYVREGDMVEKDQAILAVEGGMSDELKTLQEEYDELKKNYDLALIGDNVSYLQSSKSLEQAQEQYNEAKKEYDKLNELYQKIMSGAATDKDKEARAEELKNQKKQLEKRISELEERIVDIESKIAEAKSTISAAGGSGTLTFVEKEFAGIESRYNSLKNEAESMASELESMRKEVADMREANGLTNEIKSLKEQSFALQSQWAQLVNAEEVSQDELDAVFTQITEVTEKLDAAQQKLNYVGVGEVSDVALFKAERDLADLESESASVSAKYAEYTPIYEETKARVEALRKQETAFAEIAEYTLILDTYREQHDELQAELESLGDPDDIASQVKAAEANVKSLKSDLDIISASTYQSNHTTQLDRNDQKKKLDELSAKIKEYENAPETLGVNAPIAGRVVAVYTVPGESISSGATVADIEIADKGYTCEINVSSEEARKISVGSPVTVSNSWWYTNVEAEIVQIRPDVQSQGKNKIVIFEVKGDVFDGQEISFSVGDKSASYECVLPNSAIRSDNEGSFVYTVETKKTALGLRYKAHRTAIEVIASDDTKSAVSGLFGSEFVITNATTPITDGQMVRLAEN